MPDDDVRLTREERERFDSIMGADLAVAADKLLEKFLQWTRDWMIKRQMAGEEPTLPKLVEHHMRGPQGRDRARLIVVLSAALWKMCQEDENAGKRGPAKPE